MFPIRTERSFPMENQRKTVRCDTWHRSATSPTVSSLLSQVDIVFSICVVLRVSESHGSGLPEARENGEPSGVNSLQGSDARRRTDLPIRQLRGYRLQSVFQILGDEWTSDIRSLL
jgi:hypothetical protein